MSQYQTEKTLEHLFVSKVRLKVLKYFTLNPDKPIHLRGAVREFNEEINAVRREMLRLTEAKIITMETKGNRTYFVANVEHPFFRDLTFMIHKSTGLGGAIISASKKLGNPKFIFILPAYVNKDQLTGQAIDMVVIGEVDLNAIEEVVKNIQEEIGREIHYMVFKEQDFLLRKKRKDQIVMDLLLQDIVMLVGSHDNLVR